MEQERKDKKHHRFAVGDKVEYIGEFAAADGYEYNKVYTVTSINPNIGEYYAIGTDGGGQTRRWSYKFRPAKNASILQIINAL